MDFAYPERFGCMLGRFNPCHLSHLAPMGEGLRQFKTFVVILGSHNSARTSRDPFTSEEREQQIRSNFKEDDNKRLLFVYAEDDPLSNSNWAAQIRESLAEKVENFSQKKAVLFEHHKDVRTKGALEFLRKALDAESVFYSSIAPSLSSTEARRSIFLEDIVPQWVPAGTRDWIKQNFLGTDRHQILKREQLYLDRHHKQWSGTVYPVSFSAADAICISDEKVLLIRRGSAYGYGLLAAPGGMLEVGRGETLQDAAVRETDEETEVSGIEPYLVNKDPVVFDNPYRSLRGRVISNAFLYELPSGFFANAKTTAEALEIVDMPIADLEKYKPEFFEDHYFLIKKMLTMRTISS